MLPAIRASVSLTLMLALWGCAATPRYQTLYRYESPVDAAGQACVEKCGQKLAACQDRCKQVYQACLKDVEPLVDERYGEALKRYEDELERYRWELERCQLQLWLNWNRASLGYGGWPYYPWPEPYCMPYPLPRKPTRTGELAKLRQEKCEADCGCQPIHDTCFLACGGKKIPEERCVANCPSP